MSVEIKNRAFGCDCSRWNDDNSTPQKVDFSKMKSNGVSFVFLKASQANWADEDFIWNWKASKEAGLLRGAYHFLVWEVDPIVQADYMYSLLKNDMGELPPVCDFEWWKTTPSNATTILKRFCERIQSLTGKTPIIYTAKGFFDPLVADNDMYWTRYHLWTAEWWTNDPNNPLANPSRVPPWGVNDWKFHQYTSKGDGIKYGCESKQVDMNFFNGTVADLYKFCGLTQPQPEEPEEPTNPEIPSGIMDKIDAIQESLNKVLENQKTQTDILNILNKHLK